MRAWNKRLLAALAALVMLASGLMAGSDVSADGQSTFKQGDGYALGKYDLQAAQPTTDNWERRSRYAAIVGSPPKLKWRQATGSGVSLAPVIGSDGTIYAIEENAAGKPKVIAFKSDGTVKWEFNGQSGAAFNGSPVIAADGAIYVSSSSGLYAIHQDTGKEKWRSAIGKALSAPAIAADGTIYVGAENGNLYAIDQADGAVKWTATPYDHKNIDLHQTTPAIAKDGTLYLSACSYENSEYFLIAVDPVAKKMKWKRYVYEAMYDSPVIGADGTIYATSGSGFLFAIRADGMEKWRYNTHAWVSSSPAIAADGTIYVGTSDAYLYAVNPNGSPKWKFQTDAFHAFRGAPLIDANGTIYMATVLRDGHTADGYLYAIKADGSQKWLYKVAHSKVGSDVLADLGEPTIGADGTMYFGTNTKKFYAIRGIAAVLEVVEPSGGTPIPEMTEIPPEASPTPQSEATEAPQPEETAVPQPEATQAPAPEATASPLPEASPAPPPAASPAPAPEQPAAFLDIAGHWAEKSILEAANRQMVSGFLDGTYRPNQAVTRAQFTTMLVRALGVEESNQAQSFTDASAIPPWAKGAVASAVRLGYIQGYNNGAFRPDAKITRAEMAVVIAKVLKMDQGSQTATSFADDSDIPAWAKGAVEAGKQLGVIAGRSGNRFDPAATVTRAEAAVMLLRTAVPIQ